MGKLVVKKAGLLLVKKLGLLLVKTPTHTG